MKRLAIARTNAFGLTTAASYAYSGLISWGLAGLFISGGIPAPGRRSCMVFAAVIIAVALYMLVRKLSLS